MGKVFISIIVVSFHCKLGRFITKHLCSILLMDSFLLLQVRLVEYPRVEKMLDGLLPNLQILDLAVKTRRGQTL